MKLAVVARYYFRVADIAEALEHLAGMGFAREEEAAPLMDPADLGEAPGFLRTASSEMAALERFGMTIPPRVHAKWSHHLTYVSYRPWPTDPASRASCEAVLNRVEELCKELGAAELVCIPDRAHVFELSGEEVAKRTHVVGAIDRERAFSD